MIGIISCIDELMGVIAVKMKTKQRLAATCDQSTLAKVDLFCDYYGINENDLADDATIAFLKAHQSKLDTLAHGYVEMASLNTEIAAEFCNCEEEAALHIR